MFLAAASLMCGPGISAQQHDINKQNSTLTTYVGRCTGSLTLHRQTRPVTVQATLKVGRYIGMASRCRPTSLCGEAILREVTTVVSGVWIDESRSRL